MDAETTQQTSASASARGPLKDVLGELLHRGDLEAIADLSTRRRRALGGLLSWTYDADPLMVWRAIEAMGLAASRVAEKSPGAVREHLRRMLWLLSDESGGVCWHAPEGLAEIVSRRPDVFEDYIRLTVLLIENIEKEDLLPFLPGTLWAIGKLADVGGEHIERVLPAVVSALDATDSQTRGMAVWCLGRLGRSDIIDRDPDLLTDHGQVQVYEDRAIHHRTVADIALRALGAKAA